MTPASTQSQPRGTRKLTMLLMTEKGFRVLEHAASRYADLLGQVVVGSDKSIQRDFEWEILDFCKSRGIPCVKRAESSRIETEYCLAISWRWLIQHPNRKLIVFHDSLLPKYRGFAPLMNMLINGEPEIGVTALFGAEEYDRGDIIAQSKSRVEYPIKINDAIATVNRNYLEVADVVLDHLNRGAELPATPQREVDATYSVWRDDLDYRIGWTKPATEIRRQIDALGYPYNGAYTTFEGSVIRILDAVEAGDVRIENRHCGKVLFVDDGKPVVICGKGLLKINDAWIEKGVEKSSLFPLPRFRMRFVS